MIKPLSTQLFLSVLIYSVSATTVYSQLSEWRGPDRTGIYHETGLLKQWPEVGPELLWEAGNLGDGYSSPTVSEDAIYVTGRRDSSDLLTALTLGGNIFLISGSGDIVCVGSDGKIKWSKNHYRLYEGEPLMFGISESPLVFDHMVIASPGGKKASLVAFNFEDGNVLWETEALNQKLNSFPNRNSTTE